jgi:hypothetical protein
VDEAQSIKSTLAPSWLNADASDTAVAVFPAPPLNIEIESTFPIMNLFIAYVSVRSHERSALSTPATGDNS